MIKFGNSFQFWKLDVLKIQLWNFGNHGSLGTTKSFSYASWDFHASLSFRSMFEQQFFSFQALSRKVWIVSLALMVKKKFTKTFQVYTIFWQTLIMYVATSCVSKRGTACRLQVAFIWKSFKNAKEWHMYQQNLPSHSQDIEAINFKFPRKKTKYRFPQCQHKNWRIEFVTS